VNIGAAAAGTTVNVTDRVAFGVLPFAAVTVKVDEPAVVGVPDSSPVAGSRLRPSGRSTAVAVKVAAG